MNINSKLESLKTIIGEKLPLPETKKTKKKSKKINKQKFLFYFCRIFPAAVLLMLTLIPISMGELNLKDLDNPSFSTIFPWILPFYQAASVQKSALHIIYFLIYFLPFTSLFLLISIAIKGTDIRKLLYILVETSLTIYLFCSLSCLFLFANCSLWFKHLPWYTYFAFSVAAIYHCSMSIGGFFLIREQKPGYAEYKRVISKTGAKTKHSIKIKFASIIICFIVFTLSLFTSLILQNYKKMFTEAVSDIGRSKAEQTANVYDSAEGKYKKIQSYFEQQKESNNYAQIPFERIDIIIHTETEGDTPVYLEKIAADTVFPEYEVFAYTTGRPSKIPAEEKQLSSEQANEYIKRYLNGTYMKSPVYNKTYNTYKYIYPVTLNRQAGKKLIGFAIVTYRSEILMKAYFQNKVFVFAIGLIAIYLVIILSLFIADFLINPLLYLRANVKKTATQMEQFLARKSNLTANDINFAETIRTNDEIKDLSDEVSNLVSLIKGIVPYISFSTLQYADSDSTKKSSNRELCFLFTDIRGFTSLCEGKAPKDVVEILNHYLELETEIIIRNGGDVDKFVGDEMMAFFAGPKKEINACKAAMEIRAKMREEQQNALSEGSDIISIGIGINTGKVVFGSVGSKSRMDFTSIGDTVNIAARLESANKIYGSKSIITEAVFEKLKDTFICRELDFITVKGKTEPVRIYEILQAQNQASDKIFDIKNLFEKGLKAYRKQQWEEAEKFFNQCAQKYHDLPSIVFLERIQHFKEHAPNEKWNGVFISKIK